MILDRYVSSNAPSQICIKHAESVLCACCTDNFMHAPMTQYDNTKH